MQEIPSKVREVFIFTRIKNMISHFHNQPHKYTISQIYNHYFSIFKSIEQFYIPLSKVFGKEDELNRRPITNYQVMSILDNQLFLDIQKESCTFGLNLRYITFNFIESNQNSRIGSLEILDGLKSLINMYQILQLFHFLVGNPVHFDNIIFVQAQIDQ